MASYQPSVRLKEYHTLLRQNLTKAYNLLSLQHGVTESAIFSEERILETNRQELAILQANIKESEERLKFLDTDILVEQQTDFQTHIQKGVRPTPNLHFSTVAQYPIRKFETSQCDNCIWKALNCPFGASIFKGEVKTKAWKNASAGVKLYGWLREVSAKEISIIVDTLRSLKSLQMGFESDVKATEIALQNLHTERETVQSQTHDCTKDLQILEQFDSKMILAKEILKILKAGSVAGLAFHYGLVTRVSRRDDNSPPLDEGTVWLFSAFENEIQKNLAISSRTRKSYNSFFASSPEVSSRAIYEQLSNIFSNSEFSAGTANSELRHRKKTGDQSSSLDRLYETAADDFQALDRDLLKILTNLSSEARTKEEIAKREGKDATTTISLVFKRLFNLIKREESAREWSAAAMVEYRRHIGIVTALRSLPSTSEAWLSVFRGAKADPRIMS